ncbi:baseplate wedge subunit [Tenacibaculum phage PTm1]|uniref:Baseplate wedge subunit n=1 Tax=Tenacibaculum phage PTm1 TaxID=2547425 RepID=A0A5S9BZE7_9CAUD|nr:baseplate wedge subunit [Tenacibaculum phage PTm1]BBI90565.1 baseplate wedge subunit [Tenacibaculum phage PTm1]
MARIQINQFTDKFKWLSTEDGKIRNLRTKVTQVLNRLLPSRILSKANIFNLTLDLSQDMTNMMMFYIEDSLTEANIEVAQKESSVRGLATLTGHRATRPISSRGVIRCTFKSGIQLITPKLVLSNIIATNNENQLQYTANIVGGVREVSTSVQSFDLELIEGVLKTVKMVSDGSPLFKVELDDTKAIEQYHMVVTVNNERYTKYDSLYDMGTTTKGYYTKNGYGNQVDVIFGDNVHGSQLAEGDTITIEYRITNGEVGNLTGTETFTLTSGVYDVSGSQFDIGEYIDIKVHSGFQLGSNGESIELTRTLAGYNSRANVLLRPENLKSYLSRLTILSQVDVWTENDDLVFNMLLLPNISQKLKRFSDYLYLKDSDLMLSSGVKSDIKTMINASKRQATSSELVMHDPIFKKYAIFVYIDAIVNDKNELRTEIYDKISSIMLSQTFKDTSITSTRPTVSKSAIVDVLYDMAEIRNISIDIVSEVNENARINGYHDYVIEKQVGSVKQLVTERRTIPANTNPNLGFSELGDMIPLNRKEVPILRGGFKRFVTSTSTVDITKPIYIFYKTTSNTWDEL